MDFALSFDVIEKKQKREKSGELLLSHIKNRDPFKGGKQSSPLDFSVA